MFKLALVFVGTGLKSHRTLLCDFSTSGESSSNTNWFPIEKPRVCVNKISSVLCFRLVLTELTALFSLQHLGIAHNQLMKEFTLQNLLAYCRYLLFQFNSCRNLMQTFTIILVSRKVVHNIFN